MPDGDKRKQRNNTVKGIASKQSRAKEVEETLSGLGGAKSKSERMAAVKAKKAKEREALRGAMSSYSKKVGRR